MTRRELRRQMRERRHAMKTALASRRREVQARLRAAKRARRGPPSKWRRRALMVAIILLLLLLHLCQEAPPLSVGRPVPPTPPPPMTVEPPPIVKPPPIRKRLTKRDRPEYESSTPTKKPWLDAFRLQVAGRSVKLATCFEGVERPGAVRWVASLDAKTGEVGEHSLEPVANGVVLTREQKKCLVAALSSPPYRLEGAEPTATPERVAMVVEF